MELEQIRLLNALFPEIRNQWQLNSTTSLMRARLVMAPVLMFVLCLLMVLHSAVCYVVFNDRNLLANTTNSTLESSNH